MAGHSKWNNIKNRKGAQDAKRGKIFQKLSREIYMAAKQGDADPAMNAALRLAIDKAKAANMPNDNIDRAIKRASDAGQGENYDEVLYEAYGPGGVGLLVYTLTDNTNRTLTNVRTAINKNGGNLAEQGSVSFQFDRLGYIAIERKAESLDEEAVLMDALEAGASDFEASEEVFEIFTDPTDLAEVRDQLEKSYTLARAELTMMPKLTIDLSEEDQTILEDLIDALEDDDDVTEVVHNGEID